MCGFSGFLYPEFSAGDLTRREALARDMIRTLRHRGPDDTGYWGEPGVALAHARLSIVDLSPAGHQPMLSHGGRFVIAFNGEIYNHLDLRAELESGGLAPTWRGHSDTETLLAAMTAWGISASLAKMVGMFALALWDRERRELTLVRDRIGEKPLYYGWAGKDLVFGSELKALRVVPGFSREIDRGSLAAFMRHSYVPGPHTIYQDVYKLSPGQYVTFGEDDVSRHRMPEPCTYWSAIAVSRAGLENPLGFASDAAAIAALEASLRQSVRGQMVADVPLGAFLSGGIDSSTIVAMMQDESRAGGGAPVRTFSIGFHEGAYDEAQHAKAVARHLGTDHTELYVTSADALAVIPRLPTLYDEPFADSSQIPTFLVAKMAREHVTVALSGDAGDELFGGYSRYFLAARLWAGLSKVPQPLRAGIGRLLNTVSTSGWDRLYGWVSPVLPQRYQLSLPGDKVHKGARLLGCADGRELYRGLISQCAPEDIVLGKEEAQSALSKAWPELPSLVDQMMLMDTISYLPDDILVKVDRAAMGVSLETRVPFLDHRVVEFAWRLPMHYKIREGTGKWLLRQVLYGHVPRELIERPKMGFGVPIDAWLRGSLRDWGEALLAPERLLREGFFDARAVRNKWDEHVQGRRNWQYLLWNVLMFQAWHEQWH